MIDDKHWALWRWEHITRADRRPYLTRLIVLRMPLFSVYLHWFHSSDDPCLHDHPWGFVSVILAGGYTEWTFEPDGNQRRFGCDEVPRWYGPGSVLVRRADFAHRIEIDQRRPPLTLVLTGRRVRGWGFFTPFGWIPWRRYSHARHCV